MSASRRGRLAAALLVLTTLLGLPARSAAAADSGVTAFGAAPQRGGPGTSASAVAATPSGNGYWVASGGTVRAFGDAPAFGSSARSMVDLAASRVGLGYWLVTSDGQVEAFGDAPNLGSLAMTGHAPVVGVESTPTGRGYWLVASDGGVFTFGDASFQGSGGGRTLSAPVVGIAATPSGRGYWLALRDGTVLAFGTAPNHGPLTTDAPVVGIAAARAGYWLATADGDVYAFGGLPAAGSASMPLADVAARTAGDGYWVVAGARQVKAASTGGAVTYQEASAGEPSDADFDRLAACESSSRWALNSGNGYYGGLQFSAATWRSLGGTGLPHEHPRLEQIDIGRREWRQHGWNAWPSCARSAGLR